MSGGQGGDGLNRGQRIFDPVIELVQQTQPGLPILKLLTLQLAGNGLGQPAGRLVLFEKSVLSQRRRPIMSRQVEGKNAPLPGQTFYRQLAAVGRDNALRNV
jgi:hypothetical protein